MTTTPSRTLAALVRAAVDATGATRGWIVEAADEGARVVAGAGDGTGPLVGRSVPRNAGTCGFVLASGQPMALVGGTDDRRLAEGVPGLLGIRPGSVLCVPCATDDDVLGAMEVVDDGEGGSFSIDDVELVTLLGDIVGAALSEATPTRAVPDPQELFGELSRLAVSDPDRYAAVATSVVALLGHG